MIKIPLQYKEPLLQWLDEIIAEADDPCDSEYTRMYSNAQIGKILESDYIALKDYSIQTLEFAQNVEDEKLIHIMELLQSFFFPSDTLSNQ